MEMRVKKIEERLEEFEGLLDQKISTIEDIKNSVIELKQLVVETPSKYSSTQGEVGEGLSTEQEEAVVPRNAKPKNEDTMRGFSFALAAFLIWGFLPLYMKKLAHISPFEVLSHRIIWSVPLAGGVLVVLRRTSELRTALGTPQVMRMAGLTSLLIAANWTLYVWAIGSGHSLDAALGYYINPLFSVFLGAILLGEQLRLPQKLAIGLAAMAVAILMYRSSTFPAVALGLTASFGVYSYLKKSLSVGPSEGFLLEVLILLTPASAYVVWLTLKGQGHFLIWDHIGDTFLLLGCGVVTTVPLICYAHGAKLLRLSTIGMMQYIAPTMVFVLAIFVFDEPIDAAHIMAFPIIWLALVIYTASMLQQAHAAASAAASVAAAANARKPSRA